MTKVYVGVGSNIDFGNHIRTGLDDLRRHYGKLIVSSVYESLALGFEGDNFHNLVVSFETNESPQTVLETLKNIEQAHGRHRQEQSKSVKARTLDLDLLLYGNGILQECSVPRKDILKYAFVLLPLAEIAPTEKHPVTGQSYAELWEAFENKESQPLWKVEEI
jgi:2-amino-4-hydroxy-6-hydroxymethyldihydropteridine diphosphokinase